MNFVENPFFIASHVLCACVFERERERVCVCVCVCACVLGYLPFLLNISIDMTFFSMSLFTFESLKKKTPF